MTPHTQTQPLPAILFRHVVEPQVDRLRFFFEVDLQIGFEFGAVEAVVFDRNQFPVDKTPDGFLQHAQFFGQLVIHEFLPVRFFLSVAPDHPDIDGANAVAHRTDHQRIDFYIGHFGAQIQIGIGQANGAVNQAIDITRRRAPKFAE